MEKEPKLKTKLEFQFNVDDLEIPEMGFISEDPVEEKTEITIVKKKRNTGRKTNQKLF